MRLFFLLSLLIFLGGCNFQEREQELQLKADSLNQKEMELAVQEKALLLKEGELQEREHMLDSVQREDTNYINDPSLAGSWNVRMVCTETTCPGSAVGDTKSEIWRISFQGKWLVAASVVRNQVGRIYTGKYTKDGINLKGDVESEAEVETNTRINVRLQVKDPKNIEGTRRIIHEGDCSITYSIKLSRP